eukprot:TRINITY_DN6280_c0_g1_i1.p1 TRINITY_DN6280_c0_g1~~TRINITY_DN6280_c0_g1_i1.p1  ORF type:complete len:183 (-),score=24.60 TRINITY_DN6280_c0_g1_i1:39-587(-)
MSTGPPSKETLYEISQLPQDEDQEEWLAVNTIDFYNQINMLYGLLTHSCTNAVCPVMNAGPRYEFRWVDSKVKKTQNVSAPEYVEYLMNWIQSLLDDQECFPTELGSPFPHDFKKTVKKIFSRLFRVYAHIYHSHYKEMIALNVDSYLNASFTHFVYFSRTFGLLKLSEEAPLSNVIEDLLS